METAPSSYSRSPPPTETGGMAPSLSLPRSNLMGTDPEQQDRRTNFQDDGLLPPLGATILPPGVVRGNISDHASKQTSIEHVLSSAGASSASSGDLSPRLVIGLNSRTTNESQDNQQQSGGCNKERGRLGSVATGSASSMVDREVLVMREAMELSAASIPTPLGRQRRLSLFERANSISMPSNDGSADFDLPRAKSDRSNSSAMVKGRNASSVGLDEPPSDHDDHPSALGRDKYNTVLRDWLMHVLEKDDQQNADVS